MFELESSVESAFIEHRVPFIDRMKLRWRSRVWSLYELNLNFLAGGLLDCSGR